MKRVHGLGSPHSPEDICSPQRTAGGVDDMQIGIPRQISGPGSIVARVSRVPEAARRVLHRRSG